MHNFLVGATLTYMGVHCDGVCGTSTQLMHVRAGGEHCVLATRTDDSSGQFILILCNAIGSPIDSKYIDVEPQMVHSFV
jgi:hypothetical protein